MNEEESDQIISSVLVYEYTWFQVLVIKKVKIQIK